jgi:hypothetical protein
MTFNATGGRGLFRLSRIGPYTGGPSINLAQPPDAIHWKPLDQPAIAARKGSVSCMKVGGGSQPIRKARGRFLMYQWRRGAGDRGRLPHLLGAALDDLSRILRLEHRLLVLKANPELTRPIARQIYLPTPVVPATGVAVAGDHYIVASGEVDLACRITHMPNNALFA